MEAKKLLSLFFFLFFIFDNLIATMRLEDLNIEFPFGYGLKSQRLAFFFFKKLVFT